MPQMALLKCVCVCVCNQFFWGEGWEVPVWTYLADDMCVCLVFECVCVYLYVSAYGGVLCMFMFGFGFGFGFGFVSGWVGGCGHMW